MKPFDLPASVFLVFCGLLFFIGLGVAIAPRERLRRPDASRLGG